MITIIIPTITLILGFIFGKWRDNSAVIFSKKLEIYSEIIYKLNTGSFLSESLKAGLQKL
jgi:ABC-type amino acid transport system permease subunit